MTPIIFSTSDKHGVIKRGRRWEGFGKGRVGGQMGGGTAWHQPHSWWSWQKGEEGCISVIWSAFLFNRTGVPNAVNNRSALDHHQSMKGLT